MFGMRKTLITLCVLLCSIGAWALPVQASAEELQLTVDYTYEHTPIADAKVKIYLVAEKIGAKFVLTQQFEELDVTFEATSTPTSWREAGKLVEQYIAQYKCDVTESRRLDSVGCTDFYDLTEGVYFVDVEDMAYKGGTLVSDPVLVTLPLYCNETDDFICEVTMEPKVAFVEEPEPTKPRPTKPSTPDEPDTSEPPESTAPEPSEPPESTEPAPSESEEGEELHDIPEGGVPLTGTLAWLIIPLAVMGTGLFVIGLFGFDRKKEDE